MMFRGFLFGLNKVKRSGSPIEPGIKTRLASCVPVDPPRKSVEGAPEPEGLGKAALGGSSSRLGSGEGRSASVAPAPIVNPAAAASAMCTIEEDMSVRTARRGARGVLREKIEVTSSSSRL
jgi:hypothetical protein